MLIAAAVVGLTINLADEETQSFMVAPMLMEQCVNAAMFHSEATQCVAIHKFLERMRGEVGRAKQEAEKAHNGQGMNSSQPTGPLPPPK